MLLYFSLATFLTVAEAVCYKPDGVTTMGQEFVACNSFNSTNSYCCGAARTGGLSSDVCMPNGLCAQRELTTENEAKNLYWRQSCSNAEWPEEVCLSLCRDPSQNDSNGNAPMTPCDGTPTSATWCCGTTKDCCGKGAPLEIVLQPTLIPVVLKVAPAAISSTQTSSSASSPTSLTGSTSIQTSSSTITQTQAAATTPTSTNQISSSDRGPLEAKTTTSPAAAKANDDSTTSVPSPPHSKSLSSGALIGIGVSAGASAVSLAAALVFFCCWRRRKSQVHDGLIKRNSLSPSESASQHPWSPHSPSVFQNGAPSHVTYTPSQMTYAPTQLTHGKDMHGVPPMPPPPFSTHPTTRSIVSAYPRSNHAPSIYPKYDMSVETAELDVDRPLRELPADSAVGYIQR